MAHVQIERFFVKNWAFLENLANLTQNQAFRPNVAIQGNSMLQIFSVRFKALLIKLKLKMVLIGVLCKKEFLLS